MSGRSFRFGLSAAAALLALGASAASAHAEMHAVVPAPHAVVADAPKLVVSYSETVSASAPDVVVRGPSDFSWRTPFPPDGATVSVALPSLRAGSYVASWATKAEDGHVQLAATSFAVGAPTKVRIIEPASTTATAGSTPGPATTVLAKTTTRKGAKTTTRKAPATTTTVAARVATELTARTDTSDVAANVGVRLLGDARLSFSITLPAGAKVPDTWSLSAVSPLTNGGAIPIAVKPVAGSISATSEPAVLPPGEWTLRLSLVRGFDQQDATTALTLAAA